MLIRCPECELQASDKAISCPHCGYPLDKKPVKMIQANSKKHRKLPNGFGSITKIRGQSLRNQYRVRVCVGKTAEGKCVLKSLKPKSLFPTYNDAYAALVEYNRNPYDLDNDLTVMQLYEKWTDQYFESLSDAGARTIKSAWAYCSSVYNMRAKDVRARHIKGCMEDGFRIESKGSGKGQKKYASAGTQSRIKSMFNLMLDYALEYEIVDKNYARTFDISDDIASEIEKKKRGHIVFTNDEIGKIWDSIGTVRYADWIIIQTYMGWRPQELVNLRLDEIDMTDWYIISGMKTDAGKQRIVPIHTKIKDLISKNYNAALELNSQYLFNDPGKTHTSSSRVTYDKYRQRFNSVINQLNLNPDHRPHDPRMTFITRCKKAGVDEYALKEMVGHNIKDITESVYTVRDVEWLRADLEKMQ